MFRDGDGDGDGQRGPRDARRMLLAADPMCVGARSSDSQASSARLVANGVYNVVASAVTGNTIPDLTSGFRAVRAELFRQFLYLLPNGFSYPTTITMAFMRARHPVSFVGIGENNRIGKSHMKPLKDGIRFLIIIFKIATLYAPLKLFVPASSQLFALKPGYCALTFVTCFPAQP